LPIITEIQQFLQQAARDGRAVHEVERGVRRLALYPEERTSGSPTAALVFGALEGHRRHRLFDENGQLLRTFHDELPEAAGQVLELLGVEGAAYGLT
jgi:hypothetical protein